MSLSSFFGGPKRKESFLYWGYSYGHGYKHFYPPITRYWEPPKLKFSQTSFNKNFFSVAREPRRVKPTIRNRFRR